MCLILFPGTDRIRCLASVSTVLKTGRELYPYEAKGSASVSALPLPALRGLIRYLDAYPYTCAEQRISRAMPYALLMDRPELLADAGRTPDEAHKLARKRMDEAVHRYCPSPHAVHTRVLLLSSESADP